MDEEELLKKPSGGRGGLSTIAMLKKRSNLIFMFFYLAITCLGFLFVFFQTVFQYFTAGANMFIFVIQFLILFAYDSVSMMKRSTAYRILIHVVFMWTLVAYNAIAGFLALSGIIFEDGWMAKFSSFFASIPFAILQVFEARAAFWLTYWWVYNRRATIKRKREERLQQMWKKKNDNADDTRGERESLLKRFDAAGFTIDGDIREQMRDAEGRNEEINLMIKAHAYKNRRKMMRAIMTSVQYYVFSCPMLTFMVLLALLMFQGLTNASQSALYPAPGFKITSAGNSVHISCTMGVNIPDPESVDKGHLIILDAGMALHGMVWARVQKDLTAVENTPLTICYYDKPGLGWSELPGWYRPSPDDYTTTLKDVIHAALDQDPAHLGRTSVTLVSHGTAALYAPGFIQTYPDLVDHLVLIDPSPAGMYDTFNTVFLSPFISRFIAMTSPYGMGRLLALCTGSPGGVTAQAASDWIHFGSLTSVRTAQMAAMEDAEELFEYGAKHGKAGCVGSRPITVAIGDQSGLFSASEWTHWQEGADAMLKWSCHPPANYITIGGGHRLMIDAPMKVAGAIINNIDQTREPCT